MRCVIDDPKKKPLTDDTTFDGTNYSPAEGEKGGASKRDEFDSVDDDVTGLAGDVEAPYAPDLEDETADADEDVKEVTTAEDYEESN